MSNLCPQDNVTLEFANPNSNLILVNVNTNTCTNLGTWERVDSTSAHAFDKYAFWDDTKFWNDDKKIYDSHIFDLYICDPLIQNMNYYCTGDDSAYLTSNTFLYGVTLEIPT